LGHILSVLDYFRPRKPIGKCTNGFNGNRHLAM
jgi:hypothetical protein